MNSIESREPVLKVEHLTLSYKTRRGNVRAARDISFEIHLGEALGLVGESGCGKSTVAFAIMGFLAENAQVEGGRILFQGEDLLQKDEQELRRLRGSQVAMVYQDPMTTLNPSIRIGSQLEEVLVEHEKLNRKQSYTRCIEMLEKVQMPDPERVMERYPHQISGGQQQRVVIAMALLCNPALLVMDEPTTALDVTVEATVLDMIASLRQQFDSAVLYISHNLGVVARVCDRVGVMYAGELVEDATVDDVFLNPFHPYTQSLMGCIPRIGASKMTAPLCPIPGRVPPLVALPDGCVFQPRCGYARDVCERIHPDLVQVGGQRRYVRCGNWETVSRTNVNAQRGPTAGQVCADAAPEEALLDVRRVKTFYTNTPSWTSRLLSGKKVTHVKAVDNVSLSLPPRKILGIVGESGCGKTTLAKTIAGLIPPTAGEIVFLGVDVSKVVEKRPKEVFRELQMVFQNPDSTLNPTQSVAQILARPLRISGVVHRSEVGAEIDRLLNAVNLDDSYLDRRPRQMSGGEKQRVAIARAFASRPQLVVCDEPVSALDVSVQCSVLNTLLDIQNEYGTGLLFISHDLSMVRYLCDTIVVMYLGKVTEMGPTDALFTPPYHPYTEALLSAVPVPDPSIEQARIRLEGAVPSALDPPQGCRFHTRCPRKIGAICETEEPPAVSPCEGHVIYCHIPLEELEQMKPVVEL
ncbi:MAG: ABC transporter ATP-binding protein [Anaerolineae bacterium]|nr:ABC transporter ATP-binding protein [Anaerolineae bacterium]